MSSSSVWVQLYWKDEAKGTEEPAGDPIKIKPVPDDVADLKQMIKENNLKEELRYTGITQVNVYPPKSAGDENKYKSGKKLLEVIDELKDTTPPTSDEHPLIVEAPAQNNTFKRQRREEHQLVFVVGAIVKRAKQSNGARGNVYKFLERCNGHYLEQEGIEIKYNNQDDDLTVKAYFLSYDAACRLQNELNEWEIHKELANLGGVTLDPRTPSKIELSPDTILRRIYLQDYEPQDSESPCQTLNQLHSYRLSVPVTEPAEANTPLVKFQSIDKLLPHLNHYRCHLKDKAKFKKLQSNESNMVAVSWTFHQQLDGLNVQEGIPLVAMSVKDASKDRSAAHDNRYRVTLAIEFFYRELAASFSAIAGARKGSDDETCAWETVVYVEDKKLFIECVEWKFQDTMEQWQNHREFLNQE